MRRKNLISTDFPDNIAVITERGEEVTYSSLHEQISHITGEIKSGEVIFLIIENDFTSLLYYLASFECGAIPLLLSSDTAREQLDYLVARYEPTYIFKKVPDHAPDGFTLNHETEGYGLFKNKGKRSYKINPNLAFLATTSGSTGSPKLVRYSRDNIISNTESIVEYLGISESECAIAHLPIHYSFGFSIINSHLYAGASVYLTRKSMMEKGFWDDMKKYDITSFSGVPFHFESLLRLKFESLSLPSLKTMTQAGGKLTPQKMEKVVERCETLGIQFWTMYGQTEASPRISYLPPEQTLNKLGGIGYPVPGGQLWVRGDDGEDISYSSRTGELVYEGDNVCLGYATQTEDFQLGDENHGVLSTGDLAYSDSDGCFFLQGRINRFIKIFGNRISLDHVEELMHKKGYECLAGGMDDQLVIGLVSKVELDISQLRKEIANLIGINFTAVKIKQFPNIPRFESGKVNYQCLTS